MEATQQTRECPYCHGIMEITTDSFGRPYFKCKNTLACGATETDISSRKGTPAPKKVEVPAAAAAEYFPKTAGKKKTKK